jgi:hypothetical protein
MASSQFFICWASRENSLQASVRAETGFIDKQSRIFALDSNLDPEELNAVMIIYGSSLSLMKKQ